MHSLAELIAKNQYLQAVSVLVAIIGALLFIFKNTPPAINFSIRIVRSGVKSALIYLMKSSVVRAKIDSLDSILVIITMSFFWFKIISRWFYLILSYLLLIVINTSFEIEKDSDYYKDFVNHPILITALLFLGFLLAVASTWALVKPIAALWTYKRAVRRFVIRRLNREMKS